MTTITQLAPVLQELLTHKADALARSSGFIRRQRKMSGSGFVKGRVLVYLGKPKATRRELHASVLRSGVSISETGLDKRFNAAGALFLRQVVEAALTEQIFAAAPAGLLQQFTEVVLSDATQVKQGRLAVKLATRLFMQSGRLQVSLESVRSHDARAQVCQGQLNPGTFHLADLGSFDLAQFAKGTQQACICLCRSKPDVLLFGML